MMYKFGKSFISSVLLNFVGVLVVDNAVVLKKTKAENNNQKDHRLLKVGAQSSDLTSSSLTPLLPPDHSKYASGPAYNAYNFQSDFIQAAKIAMPTVVHIKGVRYVQQISIVDQFFGEFFGDGTKRRDIEPQKLSVSGSGVIYTSDGYIITNNHLVAESEEIEVTLHDNHTYKAKVIGNAPDYDLAVLRIDAKNLPCTKLGDSDKVEVGEFVLAIGNPLGLTSTVTHGIVSATSRSVPHNISEKIRSKDMTRSDKGDHSDELSTIYGPNTFIQTDAPVNEGNSGGALINIRGELIGINSMYQPKSYSSGFIGYGFAIPSMIVKKIADDLIRYGVVHYIVLGLTFKEVDQKLAQKLKLKDISGLRVEHINADSPCRDILRKGDIILKVNNKPINKSVEFKELLLRRQPGDLLAFTIWRNGSIKNVNLTLKANSDFAYFSRDNNELKIQGATLVDLDDKTKQDLKLKVGIYVKRIESGKLLHAGLKQGDIIVVVDNQLVESLNDFAKLMQKLRGPVIFGILRQGSNKKGLQYIAVDLGGQQEQWKKEVMNYNK